MADTPLVTDTDAPSSEEAISALLPWVGAAVAVALLGTAAIDGALLRGSAIAALVALTAVAGLAAGGVGWIFTSGPRRRVDAPMAAAVLVGLVGVQASVQVSISGEPWGMALLLVALPGVGLALRSRQQYAVVAGACCLACGLGVGAAFVSGTAASASTSPGVVGWWCAGIALALAAVLGGVIQAERQRGQTALELAHDQAARMSVRDPLTGASNRAGLAMIAVPMIENARRQGQAVHCLFIDLDGFKIVNTRLGQAKGDEVLMAAAETLQGSARSTDVVARWGADEFVIIGPGTGTSPLEMERRVRARLTKEPPVPIEIWAPRVSVGSSTLVPWDEGDLEALIRRADQDMHLRRSLRRQSGLPRRRGSRSGSPPDVLGIDPELGPGFGSTGGRRGPRAGPSGDR